MPKSKGSAISERYYAVPGLRLHVAEAGSGPLIVLLHGFPDHWYTWRHLMPALAAAGFRVIAPDMRGYNLSDKPDGVDAYRLDTLADDVAALIAAAGEDHATLVGHDWGGIVAWHTALKHPEVVAGLAVLNAPPPLPLLARPVPPAQFLRSWYIAGFQLPWLPEAVLRADGFAALCTLLKRDSVNASAFTEEDIARYVAAWEQPGALTAMVNYYRALGRHGAWDTGWTLTRQSGYAGPVLVLWGDQDPHLEAALADPAPGKVPDARVVHLPDAGHWVHLDQPEQVAAELVHFLRDP